MKFGAVTFVWASPFATSELGVLERIAAADLDIAEIAVEEPGLLDLGALRAALDEHGLAASVLGFGAAGRDVCSDDAAEREAGMAYVRHCVDVAEAAGAHVVAGPLHSAVGKARPLEPAERRSERNRAVEGLRELGAYAGERGVNLALEPLNRFENDMLNTAEQGLDLCAAVDLDNVGLLLDTFHMNVEEKQLGAAIRSAGDRLLHFHACENDRGTPGSGHIDWHDVADALRAVGFDGAVVMESFVPEVPGLAAAVSMWRPFFDDPDRFARDGLAYLRSVLHQGVDHHDTPDNAVHRPVGRPAA
jgi:D-psicose/D-tagatose/L-ribulose 3-epimerase